MAKVMAVLLVALCVAMSVVGMGQDGKPVGTPDATVSKLAGKPGVPPELSDKEKLNIKQLQIQQLAAVMDVVQSDAWQKKVANEKLTERYLATLCKATDGKQYVVDTNSLTCVLASASK